MTVSSCYEYGQSVSVVFWQGQWMHLTSTIISINIVYDSNGYHEYYMLAERPNIYLEADSIYASEQNALEECNRRNQQK